MLPFKRKTKQIKKKSFRQELRESLVKSSVLPVLFLSIFAIVVFSLLWTLDLNSKVLKESKEISTLLEETLENYTEVLTKPPQENVISNMKEDRALLSQNYNALTSFTNSQKLKADFYIFDENMNKVLQSKYPADFKLSLDQKNKGYTTFGKIWSYPENVTIEISSEFLQSPSSQELVIGKAILRGDKVTGYVVFTISASTIQEYMSNFTLDFSVTNKNKTVLSTTNINLSKKDFSPLPVEKIVVEDGIVAFKRVAGDFLNLYTYKNISSIYVVFLLVFACVIMVLAIIFYAILRTSSRTANLRSKDIEEIIQSLEKMKDGDFSSRMKEFDVEEFDEISLAYNKMIDDIEELIDQNNKMTRENFISEMKQLEMQFNSHFLFNTLENIRFTISFDPRGASENIVKLSELLRYSILGEIRYVKLNEDIRYVETYLEILKSRFGDRLSYSINLTPKSRSVMVPKLIIQPLIENAVKYGFEDNENLNLTIKSNITNGKLVVSVTDNGGGFDPESLAKIQKNLKKDINKTAHVGLFNVNRRLELVYGETSGLKISTGNGETTVELTFGEIKDDKSINS